MQNLALQAGAGAVRTAAEVRAAIANIIMGELIRLALGAQAEQLSGAGAMPSGR